MVKTNQENPFWKTIDAFLTEANVFTSLPSYKEQFFNIAKFFFKNKKIINKCNQYLVRKNNPFQNSFIKEYWSSYKPLLVNQLVININEVMDSLDKSEIIKTNYENYSLLQTLEDANSRHKYEVLEIPFSEIIMNESYQRLYDYCVHLHGKSKNIPLIDLLTNRFIETIGDSDSIRTMMVDAGWDPLQKKFRNIDFSILKKIIIIDITDYFKQKNPKDINTLNTYIHIHFNNFNGMLLNGHAKRKYTYVEPVIYPFQSFSELMNTKKDMIDTLFNLFCFDVDGDIQETYFEDAFIFNLLSDPDLERRATCYGKIPKTEDNFQKIIEHKNRNNILPYQQILEKELLIENRILTFIQGSNLLNHDADESYLLFNQIIDTEDSFDLVNNEIIEKSIIMITYISDYFNKISVLEKKNIRRFKTSFGKNLDSINTELTNYLNLNTNYERNISFVEYIVSRLSNGHAEKEKGTIFHNHIPKEWKVSETVNGHISEFIDQNEFLLQYDIFIPFSRKTNLGFNKYRNETKFSKCFQGLNEFISDFFGELDFNLLLGEDNSRFTEEFCNDFKKYLFLLLFVKIIEYIEDLSDEQSIATSRATILFRSLEESDQIELDDSIKLLNNFLFDLLIHFLEESKDSVWINQMEDISNQVSKQMEREKQNLMNNLETKTSDARLVETQMQTYGIGEGGTGGWYKSAGIGNLEHIGSEEYQLQLALERSMGQTPEEDEEDERIEDEEELERLQDDGYDQDDQDQEDEGGDEDSGNYKED